MNVEDQLAEVKRLNVGATKGLKGIIKTKLIDVNFKAVVTAKMQAYLGESRMPLTSMFHLAPGYNSEGGIALVVAVADALVDVK